MSMFISSNSTSSSILRVLAPLCLPHINHTTDAIALLHGVECRINLAQVLAVRDELVDFELAVEIVVDEIGKLAAAFDASEGAAFPDAACHELECCFLSVFCYLSGTLR